MRWCAQEKGQGRETGRVDPAGVVLYPPPGQNMWVPIHGVVRSQM